MTSSGRLLQDARQRAGLTQSELARRAGVTQSVVSDYERGRREPALTTLRRLVTAAGHALDVTLAPATAEDHRPGMLAERLRQHREEVLTLAATRGATNLRVFGSVARGEEGPASDDEPRAGEDAGCGCLPCVLAREEAQRRVAHASRLELAAALARLCRGGDLAAEELRPSVTDDEPVRAALDVARELRRLERAGLLLERSPSGPVHLDATVAPAVRSGLRRWARRCGARPPL